MNDEQQDGLNEFAAFAAQLADEARQISLAYFRRKLEVETKSDESPVTVADREIEARLRARISAHYPAHGILGEEHGRERMDAEYVWVIDPIDGTRSFVTGWPIWGTLFAVLHKGRPVFGLIDAPVTGERWTGGPSGAYDQTSGRLQTSDCRRLATANIYATSPDIFDDAERRIFEEVSRTAGSRRFGGDCYAYAMVAAGHVDAVVEAGLQPYDYLAIVPVVEAAGGRVTDWRGDTVGLGSDGRIIAAATPELHAELLAITRRL
ncbi:histidinol-phosphatase [Paraburkholderia caballeronis]|uniref:Histidinol-phosphatase n=1 Tax=Paraburkholderia caballeronis TaxID=416943 RepID=A0A1H7MSB5_9BURK|nr:histidinol-phosphatase [Paraburkholderia caballeronis]PXW26437.1 myo-inositol-1(or 4)-monophosphatase [Paraburkholderia caballeronis]PXX01984.1 myo-inositol-1(or 4)-monophosphatase [Paraburkholderia caballeronis]RAK01141.1 myo-inositol-1(or 4)-monophosphatase [Paraburkholderia caballeronis]SEB95708.1 myo-inositol-1(or 4)-monophosphatase [Paraburkholderia caballeronis]SEL14246.1 myo-inositol-1(or 4)-monophosphatase [Paraburkholderia caballeronis]